MTDSAIALEAHLQRELGKRVIGMEHIVHGLTIAVLVQGHVLLDGPPGLGKTRLSNALATVIGGEFKRVQGTADLMPTDITGLHIYNSQRQEFEFQPGPLFADVVLMDEINRTGPKTQSALLEAMEERQVTIDRVRFELAANFTVIATRNSEEFEGTFPLPESQLDRFTLSIPVRYLERADEAKILDTYGQLNSQVGNDVELESIPAALLEDARKELAQVHVSNELNDYVMDIVEATRSSESITLGLSTRGALALIRAARIEALLRGGDFVLPDDVKTVAPWVIAHRLRMAAEATIEGVSAGEALENLLQQVAVPK